MDFAADFSAPFITAKNFFDCRRTRSTFISYCTEAYDGDGGIIDVCYGKRGVYYHA